jgi:hypothetical protein
MSYPKWLYHREEDPKVVNDPDEHDALGAGWEESPAAFEEPEPEAEPEPEKKPKRGKAKE